MGARRRRQWARRASIVMCILMLPGVPIGTVIGVYLLFYLWDGWPEPREYASVADAFATDDWRDGRRDPPA